MSRTFQTLYLRRSPRFAGDSAHTSTHKPPTCALPPPSSPNQKTVFLDLDHTLIDSVWCTPSPRRPRRCDFLVKFDQLAVGYVTKRPYVDEFLKYLNHNNYEIVIFTAGVEAYASAILDKLDPKGLISHRLYRSSCKILDGKLAKDLSGLGRNLKNVVIIDDRPSFYRLQPENGIPITPFIYNNARDDELKKLMDKFFNNCDQYEDLKDALKHYLEVENQNRRSRKLKKQRLC